MPEHDPISALRATNPIDEHEVSTAWATSPLRQQLLEEIEMSDHATLTRTTTDTRPRWTIARLGAVAAVLAAAAVVIPNLTSQPAAYAIRPLEDGRLEVTVDDLGDGTALGSELRGYGVEVTLVPEVASPSMVGQVTATQGVGVDDNGDMPAGMEVSADGEAFRFTIDPAVFDRALTLYIGVPADPGQDYAVADSAFARGEALAGLHCTAGPDLTADEVAAAAADLGITVEWSVLTEITPDADGYVSSSRDTSDTPDGRVVSAHMRSADTAKVEVVPDGLANGEVVQMTEEQDCTS